jgi:hypothetical protein
MSGLPALQGLYGAKAANLALAGNVGGLDRVQEVHTPDWFLDAVCEAFQGPIQYDPCAPSNPAHWFAERNVTLPPEAVELERCLPVANAEQKRAIRKILKPYYLSLPPCIPGLDTYDNPPFAFLQTWMRWCQAQSQHARVIAMWPVRIHRQWWPELMAGSEMVALDARLAFKGHDQFVPFPMCAATWGVKLPPLGKRETWRFQF